MGEARGFKHWVKNRVPSEEEQMGVFFSPCLGSKSGIHVSPGFVLRCDGGNSGRRRPGCWAPGDPPRTPCLPARCLPCHLGWWAAFPDHLLLFYLFLSPPEIFLSLYFLPHPLPLSLKAVPHPVPSSPVRNTQLIKYPQTWANSLPPRIMF